MSCGGGQQLQTRSLLLLAERTVPASVRFVKKEELESRKVVEEGTAGSVDYEMEALDLGSDATGALQAAAPAVLIAAEPAAELARGFIEGT